MVLDHSVRRSYPSIGARSMNNEIDSSVYMESIGKKNNRYDSFDRTSLFTILSGDKLSGGFPLRRCCVSAKTLRPRLSVMPPAGHAPCLSQNTNRKTLSA